MSKSLPFHQIHQKMRTSMGEIVRHYQNRKRRQEDAIRVLQRWGRCNDEARQLLSQVTGENGRERLILPHIEPWGQVYDPPAKIEPMVIVGTDGSQIAPTSENPYEYMVVHVAAVMYSPDQETVIRNGLRFWIGDDLWRNGEQIDSDYTELIRDVDERSLATSLVQNQSHPVVIFYDGVVELFRAPGSTQGKQEYFNSYIGVLTQLAQAGIIIAGYVDAPKAPLVIKSLEILDAKERLIDFIGHHPFEATRDDQLFDPLLRPGQRSAIMRIQSPSSESYADGLELFCFYVKVSGDYGVFVARVELPRYVAENPIMVERLHGAIIQQCELCAYPICLIRAHEEAVITTEDKAVIDGMITTSLLRVGIMPHKKPPKSHFKNKSR